jgi:cytochrome c oxidase assembly factor CtaG
MEMVRAGYSFHGGTNIFAWAWEPSVIIGLALFAIGYIAVTGTLRRRYAWGPPVPKIRMAAFYLGCLVLFLALCSPLDSLGDEALFSAHMAQHMLLIFGVPPLWLMGLPDWLVQGLYHKRAIRWITSPVIAGLVFALVLLVWHIPMLYDAALEDETVHILEHLMFIGAAVIGWSPALSGGRVNRVSAPVRMVYLFVASLPFTALGVFFTFANKPFYPFYSGALMPWGLNPVTDQQLGGLLMWLPGGLVFLAALLVTLAKMLSDAEPSEPRATGKNHT